MIRRCSGPSRRVSLLWFENWRGAGSATDRPYVIPHMQFVLAHLHIHWRDAKPALFEVAAVRQVDPALRDKGLTEVAKILKDKPLWELGPFPTEGDADGIRAKLLALGV